MHSKTALLCGAAAFATAVAVGAATQAAETTHSHKHHAKVVVEKVVRVDETPALRAELESLRQQVEELRAAQSQNLTQAQAQTEAMRAQVAQAQAEASAARTQVAEQIKTLPGEVHREVAAAAPKTDKIYYKGVTVQLGGFAAMETIYRSHNEGADISSSYNNLPFPNSAASHTHEERFTARQSRLSLLAQGDVSHDIHLTGYGEFDFQAAAVTANSNESNSYNPRIRHLFSEITWDQPWGGLDLLAGQNWSLVTMNTKGIIARQEGPPPVIDGQYLPGFVWARQPQMRLTANLNKQFWLALSVENPQTTFFSTGKFNPGVSVTNTITPTNGFPSQAGVGYTLSLNKQPDVIAKAAVDETFAGHGLHAEVFGIYRDFYARVNNNGSIGNEDVAGGGVGGGIILNALPALLDLQVSGLYGRGIGRYGSTQLSDVSFGPDGTLKPIREWDLMAGGTLHIGKAWDFYVFAGEERESAQPLIVSTTVFNGAGSPYLNNAGCETEGGACGGSTHYIDQVTAGFWDRPYVGKFGKVQWGIQYSYSERHLFPGYGTVTPGAQTFNPAPAARENMIFTSIRYYPF